MATARRAEVRDWAVVGGGMLGMALAHRLEQHGRSVTVFEAAPHLGGLAAPWEIGGVTWDRHYHVTLLSDLHTRGLLRDLGIEGELEWGASRTGVWAGGRVHSVSNALEFLLFPHLSPVDKVRLAATILRAAQSGDPRPFRRVPVEEWLVQWSGRRAFDGFWRPLLQSKLGDAWRDTAASFIRATIRRLYAARRAGLKEERFGFVRGGYARVLSRLTASLASRGVGLETGRPVAAVVPDRRGFVLHRDGEAPRRFRQVVVTTPAGIADRMCQGLADAERARLRGVRYQGIVCASALLDRPLRGFYVTNLVDGPVPFTGVIEMTALVDRGVFGGRSLVYLPRYVEAGDPFYRVPDDAVRRDFLDGLGRVYPEVRGLDPHAFRVSRVPHVMAIPTLGSADRLPPLRTSVPGLYLLNSAHIVDGTANVNETVRLADVVAPLLETGTAGDLPPADEW
jgi:protoporphyrinogen oxidase